MRYFRLGPGGRTCDGVSRRNVLGVGTLSALGLALPALLQARAAAGTPERGARSFGKAKSCIFLFHFGGPSQHETFDPKPDAPAEIRGEFGTIPTTIPGYRICDLLPLTARQMHLVSVVRSVFHDDEQHNNAGYQLLTGFKPKPLPNTVADLAGPKASDHPSFGAVLAHQKPRRGSIPAWVQLPYEMVNGVPYPGQTPGCLGGRYGSFWIKGDPSDPKFEVPDVSLASGLTESRMERRRAVLHGVDGSRQGGPAARELSTYQERALDLVTGAATRSACRLEAESPGLRDRYGRNRFGQSVLMARRLIEAGVGLVNVHTIGTAAELFPFCVTWDTHGNNFKDLKNLILPVQDPGYAALLADLEQRGLLEETLVVWMGEFGRTPKINASAGRDHWPYVFPAVLAGGGIRRGVVYGESDAQGAYPTADPVTPQDIAATIYHCCGIPPETHLTDREGRQFPLCTGTPIRGILEGG
jgi:hypothetical protein